MAYMTVTVLGSDRKIAVNIDAIGYIEQTATGHVLIYIGDGEMGQIHAGDTFDSIMDWLKDAGEAY